MEQPKRLKHRILVIGEGITEFYYFQSLKDLFPSVQIEPSYPKHTSLHELSKKINEGVNASYAQIFCVVDMDNKEGKVSESERQKYEELKTTYSEPVETSDEG